MVPHVDVPPPVHQAMRRAGLVWLRPVDPPTADRPTAAWMLWRDGAAYLVTGPGEQPAPGVAEAAAVEVTVAAPRGGGPPMTWRAAVSRVEPGGERWRAVLPALVTRRLNSPDSGAPGATEARWAADCTILCLTPTDPTAP